ncbi:hypothetical protein EVAR_82072_1 [Eumeta japonica]|uniref:Uncharacterized protein n=1 Tax=Eumeta variegata TaxID=151549 RepID=A0A4C1U1N8_EUMVA|nr:hypothetical protein EVAR_82072_1 [Eumeta japonica]
MRTLDLSLLLTTLSCCRQRAELAEGVTNAPRAYNPLLRSSRASYGDDAISYVQLKRDAHLCTVKCKMCPEHKVHAKLYGCTLIIDEEDDVIVSVVCEDCVASRGGKIPETKHMKRGRVLEDQVRRTVEDMLKKLPSAVLY